LTILLYNLQKKEKEKSLKDASVKHKKRKKDMASNTDPIQTENQAKLDDEEVQTNKKISKEVDEGLKLSKDINRKRQGNRSEEKQKKGQNAEEEPEIEEVIFHHKENGTESTDAVYIKGRVSKTDLKTDNIQEELEEMLARNGFNIDNVKITTMKCISNGQSKEECLKEVMASQSSCKECKCEISKNDQKEEKVEPSKEVTYSTEKTTDVLQKEKELCLTKLDQFRKNIEKRHFEIRHIKTHPWMNGRICRVEDVSGRKSRYDPRLVCSIKGEEEEGKLYSLKPSTMVDCYVEVEDLDIYSCHNNSMFKKQEEDGLCEKMVLSFLARALLWLEDQGNNLVHQQARSANLKRIISEDVDNAGAALAKAHIKCMDFPEEGDLAEIDPMSATLAALRPGCIGDGTVDFTRFGEILCGCRELCDQLRSRFKEFLITGMCVFCQIYYIERQPLEAEKGNIFLGETFVKLSRPTPTAFYGEKSRLCLSLNVQEEDYYEVCDLVDECFKLNSPKPSLTTKLLMGFVKPRFEKARKKAIQKNQFDTCLEMMVEAGLVKQVGNSILHLSSFKRPQK